MQEMISRIPQIRGILQGKDAEAQMLTPFGVLSPPLGSLRLKAVEVVLVLILVDNSITRKGPPLQPSLLPERAITCFLTELDQSPLLLNL